MSNSCLINEHSYFGVTVSFLKVMETDLRIIFKWHLLAFYIFGLSPYPFAYPSNLIVPAGANAKYVRRSEETCWLFKIPYIIVSIYLTIVTTSLIVIFSGIDYQKHLFSSSKTDEILAILFVGGNIICSFAIITQLLFHSKRVQTLIIDLSLIDNILQNLFRRKLFYDHLKSRICKAYCLILIFTGIQMSIVVYRMWTAMYSYLWVSIHAHLLNTIATMACLQIIFYLQLINFYYDELNRYLVSVMRKLNPSEAQMKCKPSALFYFIKTDRIDQTRFDSFFVSKRCKL